MAQETVETRYTVNVDDYVNGVNRATNETEQLHREQEQTQQSSNKGWKMMAMGVNAFLEIGGKAIQILGALASKAIEFRDAADNQGDSIDALNLQLRNMNKYTDATSEAFQKQAKALEATTNFTDNQVMESQKMLLIFENIGTNIMPKATETTLDMAEALGMDTTSAAKLLGKALDEPIEGMGALRKAGVNLSLQQEEQIKKFTESNDIASAQGIILDELNGKFGGHAKTAKDELETLSKSWQNFKEVLGVSVKPIVDGLALSLAELVEGMTATARFGQIDEIIKSGNVSGLTTEELQANKIYTQMDLNELVKKNNELQEKASAANMFQLGGINEKIKKNYEEQKQIQQKIYMFEDELELRVKANKEQEEKNRLLKIEENAAKSKAESQAKETLEVEKHKKTIKEIEDIKLEGLKKSPTSANFQMGTTGNDSIQREKDKAINDQLEERAVQADKLQTESDDRIQSARARNKLKQEKKDYGANYGMYSLDGLTKTNDDNTKDLQKISDLKGLIEIEEEKRKILKDGMDARLKDNIDYAEKINKDIADRTEAEIKAEKDKADAIEKENKKNKETYKDFYDAGKMMTEDWLSGEWKSVAEYGKVLSDKLTIKLSNIASEETISALYETALGVGSYAMRDAEGGALHMASAGLHAQTAAAAGLGAIAAAGASRGFSANISENKNGTNQENKNIVDSSKQNLDTKMTVYEIDDKSVFTQMLPGLSEAIENDNGVKFRMVSK